MNIILITIYGLPAILILITGWLYPSLQHWSFLAAPVFVVHYILSLIVSRCKIEPEACKLIASYWYGLSTLGIAGLLIPYVFMQNRIWLLGIIGLALVTLGLTAIFVTILKPRNIK